MKFLEPRSLQLARRRQRLRAQSAVVERLSEDYPRSPTDPKPFFGDRNGRYVRKHVPILSFREVQTKKLHKVVRVDTHNPNNAFVTDIGGFIADPKAHPLPEYIFYSPNLDDDEHDPTANQCSTNWGANRQH